MKFRPPPPAHTNGFLISTPVEAQKDPWGRPVSTEKPSCGPEKPNGSPTLHAAASRAMPRSASNWPSSLLIGSTGFTAPRTR